MNDQTKALESLFFAQELRNLHLARRLMLARTVQIDKASDCVS
jgi:hypothetical protein